MGGHKSYLILGNNAFRKGMYGEAIKCYERVLVELPALIKIVNGNLELCRRRLGYTVEKSNPTEKDKKIGASCKTAVFIASDVEAIRSSGLFDEGFYLEKYPDARHFGVDPLEYYLRTGWKYGHNPSRKFSTTDYLDVNRDVLEAEISPLLHYVKWGQKERRLGVVAECKRIIERRTRQWDEEREREFLFSLHSRLTSVADQAVSVVMPTYNRAYCIRSAIESVLQQTHTNWELVVVDDGGDDDTRSVVQSFRDNRISYIKHHQRKGVSAARNTALAECRGDWIFFLDSDNRWRTNYLETMLRFVVSKSLDAAYCAANLTSDEGASTGVLFADFDFESCLRENFIDLNTFCVRRDLSGGGFDERLRRLVDWDYILRIAARHLILAAPFIGVDYYDGNNTNRVTRSEYKNRDELLSIRQSIAQRAAKISASPDGELSAYQGRIAVVFHIYHEDYVQDCLQYLSNIPFAFQLYVTTSVGVSDGALEKVRARFGDAVILMFPNIGGDVAPFVEVLSTLSGFDLVCKIHTKRDVPPTGPVWREYMLRSLLGAAETVNEIINVFRNEERISILGPAQFYKSVRVNTIAETRQQLLSLARQVGIEGPFDTDRGFFAGTMFWARPRQLLRLARELCDTPFWSEAYKEDGLPQHAVERLIGLAAIGEDFAYVGLAKLQPGGEVEISCVPHGGCQNTEAITITLKEIAGYGLGGAQRTGNILAPLDKEDVSARHPGDFLRPIRQRIIYFFPDYRVNNAYQTLLYEGFEGYEVRPGTIDDCLKMLESNRGNSEVDVIFHLHWLHPLVTPASTHEEAKARVDRFIEKARLFTSREGRIIWTVHNVISHEPKYHDEEIRLSNAVSEHAEWIHVHHACVVDACKTHYKLPLEKIVVAEHGNYVDTLPASVDRAQARKEMGIQDGTVVFLFLGQIRGYKGIDELLATYVKLSVEWKNTRLVIAGKVFGIDLKELEGRVRGEPNVILHPGYVPEEKMQFYLKAADVMVLPYKKVLTSGSVLLAMSFGLPVICPRAGLLAHIVCDDRNGLIYEPDDPQGLYGAMSRFLNKTATQHTQMGRSALAAAKAYRWEDTSRKIRMHLEGEKFGRVVQTNLAGTQRRWFIRGDMECLSQKRTIAIVLHYQNISDTINCVEAIVKEGSDIGVVLISNSESIDDAYVLAAHFPKTLIVQSEENVGYAAANNLGLWICRELRPEFFWILNPDIVTPPGYYKDIIRKVAGWPSRSFFGSTIVHVNQPERVLFCGGEVDRNQGARPRHLHMGELVGALPKVPFSCDYLTGANIFGRSRVLEEVGYLPENYFLYFEETDWFLGQGALSIEKPLVFPDLVVMNNKRSEEQGLPTRYYIYYFLRNFIIFGRKYSIGTENEYVDEAHKFAQAWLKKIGTRTPQRLREFEELVRQALADGIAGRDGRVDLDKIHHSASSENSACCVICGGTSFGPGPGGRLAVTRLNPRCESCQSLERHRAIREYFERVRDTEIFGGLRILQFSKDPSVCSEWFKYYEYSVYGGHNSLDLCNIDRHSDSYDLVICNHVLEHVPDDAAALREMLRIINRNGAIFLTVPDPCRNEGTRDWGYPDEKQHGHFRYYGEDIVDLFSSAIPEAVINKVSLADSVTGTPDMAFIISRTDNELVKSLVA